MAVMVMPVRAARAQRLLKVVKTQADTAPSHRRRAPTFYAAKIVPFVPFTKLEGDSIKGRITIDAPLRTRAA